MPKYSSEIKKLASIATDLNLSAELRTRAIQQIGNTGDHDALIALLDLAANEELIREERELALQQAREIIKSGH